MRTRHILLVLSVLVTCALGPRKGVLGRAADPAVSAGMPHSYGIGLNGEGISDPYLYGDEVWLTWTYSGDEGAIIPDPGYWVVRSVSGGPWTTVASGLDQGAVYDSLAGVPDRAWVCYMVVTRAPGGFPQHFSPLHCFQRLVSQP